MPHRGPGTVPGSGGHTLSLFSLSKAYGMAGWRIGYAAVPQQLIEVASRLAAGELVERLVLDHGVAVLPGDSFGLPGAPGRVVLRLSYGMLAGDELEEALRRLFEGVRRFRPRVSPAPAPPPTASPPPPPAQAPRHG